jgi:uncharacterized protein (TIGR02271 family)
MTNSNINRRAIGTFPNRSAAEQALQELKDSGFPMDRVSVVARDSDQQDDQNDSMAGADIRDGEGNKADDGVRMGALTGGAVGGLTGLLVGLGTLAIPGIGPILLAGEVATALATTAAGGAIGVAAGSLLGGLVGLGIPEEQAKVYNERVSAGDYLVMVNGNDAEIAQAEAILNHRGIREWRVYDVPATGSAAVNQTTSTVPGTQQATPPIRPVAAAEMAKPGGGRPTDAQTMKLYEERLVVDKSRQKIGEVAIGKHIETETRQVSTPVEKERVVVVSVPLNGAKAATSNGDPFDDQQATARVEIFEETPNIHKEVFVREEVGISKQTDQETVNTEETLRREELDVDSQGRPIVDHRTNQPHPDRH